jgi:hypothetical protein
MQPLQNFQPLSGTRVCSTLSPPCAPTRLTEEAAQSVVDERHITFLGVFPCAILDTLLLR